MDFVEGEVIERENVPIGITCSYPYESRGQPERTITIERKEQIDALRDRVVRERKPIQSLTCQYPGDDLAFTVSRIKGTDAFQLHARVDCLGGGRSLKMICDALMKK